MLRYPISRILIFIKITFTMKWFIAITTIYFVSIGTVTFDQEKQQNSATGRGKLNLSLLWDYISLILMKPLASCHFTSIFEYIENIRKFAEME